MADRRLDGAALLSWAHTAVGELISHSDEINRLNVFPVADADTGTNMLFTMRAALAEATVPPTGPADGTTELAHVASSLARGAVHGARGNSGMILSQILRGLADVTAAGTERGQGPREVDAGVLATALRHAVGLVVSALGGDVVPGTIVSVLQAAATAAEHSTTGTLGDAVAAAGDAAVVALEKTPDQLPVLAEAGVVDSGGRGLVVLLDALRTTVTSYTPVRPAYEPRAGHDFGRSTERSRTAPQSPPQFEVMYLLADCPSEVVDDLRARLEALGDSVALAEALPGGGFSVHVHTDDAGAAIEAGLEYGTPGRIQISLLSPGLVKAAPGSFEVGRAVLAVVDGDGAAQLFSGEGAVVLRPDTSAGVAVDARHLVRALIDTGAAQVMVLPNGYVAAEELVAGCAAAIGWGIDVVPVPTGSMVHGLAALAVHDPTRRAVDDGYTMAAAAGATRYGSVREAAEAALTWAGPCRVGDGLGIVGGEVLVVRHDITAAARGLIDLMLAVGGELVTVLLGAGADPAVGVALTRHVHLHHPGTELVSYQTGHTGDVLIIGVE